MERAFGILAMVLSMLLTANNQFGFGLPAHDNQVANFALMIAGWAMIKATSRAQR